MLSTLVGQVDWNAAAVLCTAFATLCIIVTAAIAKRRSKRELEMQFEIDQHKLDNDDRANDRLVKANHETSLAKISFERDIQFKRIDSGLLEGTKIVGSNYDQ